MRAHTGLVSASGLGPYVEQIGWGVARQVVRALRSAGADEPLLDRLPDLAEDPGQLVYAVFERRTAVAAALVSLPAVRRRSSWSRPRGAGHTAVYEGDVLLEAAPPGCRDALLVRALHDAAAHGVPWLTVAHPQDDLVRLGFH